MSNVIKRELVCIDLYDSVDNIHYYFNGHNKCKRLTKLSDKPLYNSFNDSKYLIYNRYHATRIEYNESLHFTEEPIQIINNRLLKYTNPEYYKYLVNKNKNVFPCGQYEEEWICQKCGKIFIETPLRMVSQHRSCTCPNCSKKRYSYPEMIMYYLLKTQNIDFIIHKRFEWSHNKEYDFYLPKEKCIIETHGEQHYEDRSRWASYSLKKQIEIDDYKKRIALEKSEFVKKYIIIDCRISTLNYIKNNIEESELSNIINFKKVDWKLIGKLILEHCINGYNNEIINIWNSGIYCLREISRMVNVSPFAIKCCLIRNQNLLNAKIEDKLRPLSVEVIKDGTVLKEYDSVKELTKNSEKDFKTKFNHENVYAVICGKDRSYKGYFFRYKGDNSVQRKIIKTSGKDTKGKKVAQYSLDGKFIKEWNSISSASKGIGGNKVTANHIGMCCNGRIKTAHGYKWIFME